ncbi:hypothetical protein, partial [Parvimonas sp. M13]
DDGVPGITVNPHSAVSSGSKLLRSQPFLAALEAGKVYIVRPDPDASADMYGATDALESKGWQAAFIEEAETFPEGSHDDQLDSVAIAYNELAEKKALKASIGREKDQNDKKTAGFAQKPQDLNKNHGKGRSSVTFGRR